MLEQPLGGGAGVGMFRKGSVELLSPELENEKGLNTRPDFSRQGRTSREAKEEERPGGREAGEEDQAVGP